MISAPGSFLFSLRNKDNLSPFQALLRNGSDGYAMYGWRKFGPTFGGGHDLFISENINEKCYTDFGHTYHAPPGYTYGQPKTQALLAGSYYFKPSEVEVLYIN